MYVAVDQLFPVPLSHASFQKVWTVPLSHASFEKVWTDI